MPDESLLYDAAVLHVIRAICRKKGIRNENEEKDAIHNVVLACIEHVRKTGKPPPDVRAAIAIARPIADRRGSNEIRDRARRGRTNVGSTDAADEHAREEGKRVDWVDRGRLVAALKETLTPAQIEALSDLAAGASYAEMAADTGRSEAAERKSAERSREAGKREISRRGYVITGGFAALLAGVLGFVVGDLRAPVVSTHGKPSDGELAVGERRAAADACNAQKWDACERALDEAAALDPDGERRIEVKALRAAIAAGKQGK